jgi:hypothetical protein
MIREKGTTAENEVGYSFAQTHYSVLEIKVLTHFTKQFVYICNEVLSAPAVSIPSILK